MGYTFVGNIEEIKQQKGAYIGVAYVLCPHCHELMYTTWCCSEDEKKAQRIKMLNTFDLSLHKDDFKRFHAIPDEIRTPVEWCCHCQKKIEFHFGGTRPSAMCNVQFEKYKKDYEIPPKKLVVRAILKFWENYYESMPGYKENCLRIAQEKREKEQAKRNAERAKREEKERKARVKKEEEATWKSVKEHRDHVAAEGESLILSFTKSVQNEKEKHRASIIQSAKIALEQDQADANQQLSQLGFFAFQAKSDLKKKIAAIQNDLLHIDQCHYARPELDKLEQKASAAIEAYRKEIKLYLSKRFRCIVTQEYNCPIDLDVGETEVEKKLNNAKRNILIRLNSSDKPIDLDTLKYYNSELCAYTDQRVSALMTQLLQSGYIVRSERNGKAHYAITRKLSITVTEQWTENQKMARKSLPAPPPIESAFFL